MIPLVRRYLFLLLLISTGTLFFRLGSLPLAGADEPRYARIAQEMRQSGNWITPTLEAKPWLEKPPLYYWITAPFYSVFTDETAARTGNALCALLTALAIFALGTRFRSRHAGFLGAAILLTSLGFVGFGRSASTDIAFTCCLTLALSILAAAFDKDIGIKVLAAYVFLGLAILAKGPVAVILAAGIGLLAWYVDERSVLPRRWRIVPGLIITAAVSIPWFWLAFSQNGYAFISTFVINHNIARYLTDIHHHSQPFYYYVPVILGLIFPWTGWLLMLVKSPAGALRRWREWDPRMVFLVCWFLFPILFFSLSGSKLAGYVLPSLPPLALILALRLDSQEGRLRPAVITHLVLSALMAFGTPIYFYIGYGGNWQTGIPVAAAILIPAAVAFFKGRKGNFAGAVRTTAIQGVLIVVALALFAFPVMSDYHSTRDIARLALQVRKASEPILTYRYFHHTLHYYTGYQVTDRVETPEGLVKYGNCLIVTNDRGLAGLSGVDYSLLGKEGDLSLVRVMGKQ